MAAVPVGERHDRVVDRGHPGVELLLEPAGQEPDVGPADRYQRAVDGDAFVPRLLDDLFERRRDREDRLAGAGTSVERHDRDLGVEQQFERESLLFVAGSETPRLGHRV